jgi:uncharacterized protein with PIN domain
MIHKCPHCNEEITYLNVTQIKTNIGTYNLEADENEFENEPDVEEIHTCPECEKEVDPWCDLIDENE